MSVRGLALLAAAALGGCIDSFSLGDAGPSCDANNGGCPAGERCSVDPDGGVACGCPLGQHLFAGGCRPDAAPRPVAPLSLGNVTQRRPTLRWVLPAGYDGAEVQLCRDRGCASVIETLTVSGTSARPTGDLSPRGVVFWRVRARAGGTTDAPYGPTWLFHVPARSASGEVDTGSDAHLDVNGDGFDDVAVGAANVAAAFVYLGDSGATPLSGEPIGLGGTAGSGFGELVAGAGDLNGDGYGDLVVSAPLDSPGGRFQAGTASVFLGSATGIATTAAVVLAGVDAGDRFGAGAKAGDLNGDGYGDLAVGSYLADPRGRVDAGTASVFLGSAAGVPATAARVLAGAAAGDNFGAATSAGDVNGDGYADLVVGALHASPSGRGWAGTASVFHGSIEGVPTTPAIVLEGVTADGFAASVASAGDVNGDGYSDLVVGAANGARAGGARTGTASVFHGSAEGVLADPAVVLAGAGAGDYFGHRAVGACDVNGDGYADLVVGALVASPGGRLQAGTASVFHGSAAGVPTAATVVLRGASMLERFSSGLAAGDLDGDGYADVVVGAPLASPGGRANAGTVSVFPGSAAGLPASAATVLEGAARNGGFGTSVAHRRPPSRLTPSGWRAAPPRPARGGVAPADAEGAPARGARAEAQRRRGKR